MADLILAPVRHGIAKPTTMFNLLSTHTDILQSLDEVFNIDSEYSRVYQRSSTDAVETDLEEDDNHSDIQSQPEINHSTNHERQQPPPPPPPTGRETIATSLSDNESEMELELLAESDSDNESNHSAPNTNTHRTSATAGSENMTLFSDDENSESDDADSIRSDSVLGEGDDTSQTEPMIFDDTRDALAAAAAVSTATTTTGTTIDRLVAAPSTNNNAPTGSNTQTANSHLTVPRLPTRTAITSL
jgi:E3 ubiquitin-protein ligase EDD1